MAKNQTQLKTYGQSRTNNVENEMAQHEKELRKKKQMENMDAKMQQLAQKAIEFLEQYGEEDYRYQMMVTFLDVSFQMKDAIALIDAVDIATEYLEEAIHFMDDSLSYQDQFNKQLMAKQYGFFARWKRRREMRKAMKYNRYRLDTMIKTMLGRVELAQDITDMMRTGFEGMRYSMAKTEARRRKKEAKRAAKSGTPLPTQERALRYINEMRGTSGSSSSAAGSATAGGASASAPSASAPAPASSGGSAPDISDIL